MPDNTDDAIDARVAMAMNAVGRGPLYRLLDEVYRPFAKILRDCEHGFAP